MTEVVGGMRADDAEKESLLKDDGKVLLGKNGRLFLDNDTNHVIKQHTGERSFSNVELRAWRRVLENRIAWLESRGIRYFFLVPPNAHSVYPEDLPDEIPSAARRPIHQLIDHLTVAGSPARLIYPLDQIVQAKPDPDLYPLTDPHWNGQAAFIAYKQLAKEIAQTVEMHEIREEDVDFRRYNSIGELGFKLKPRRQSERIRASVRKPQAFLVSDNQIFNRGMRIVTRCSDAPHTTCLVLGDSFCGWLWPFFAASFRRFIYTWVPTLDYELVERERPDVVVSVWNERFMIAVPNDMTAPSASDVEGRKRAEQEQLRREVRLWPKEGEVPGET
jgi:alginate O-acetyltransferase complex protein AlgJ